MDNKPLNEELLRALAYYGAAGGSGGGGGTGTNNYGDLLGKPIITSEEHPTGVTINGTKSLRDYGIAESLQDWYNKDNTQEVSLASESTLKLKHSTVNSEIELSTTRGVIVSDGTNSGQLTLDGHTVFNGNFLYNLLHSLENQMSKSVTVDVNNWSATTTTVNGIQYYTNVLTFTRVLWEHPEVTIDVMNTTDILPSKEQRDAYTLVTSSGYFNATLNNNKITCYSQVKPTSSFKIRVKGAN